MKNFTTLACLSLILTSFAIAEETPKFSDTNITIATNCVAVPVTVPSVPPTLGMTIEQMFKLRQMYEDFTNKEPKNFSFRSRPDEICVKNNFNGDEVCIHKIILAEMLLEAYKRNDAEILKNVMKMLEQFKRSNLPELNVDLQTSKTDPTLPATVNFKVATPDQSFVWNSNIQPSQENPKNLAVKHDYYVQNRTHFIFDGEVNPRNQEWTDYALRMRNLKPETRD